ncbi:MAG: uracil-DNA glycosylase family protein [Prevotellaceae bacterium]|jgi:G:T/U-mismatch repair DNA glycosylase|nr:uracil-DNA glycosylase family protein [Prevotellaceae bacterium]
MEAEQHPLQPFLPANARLLMLGSFPPQRKRWSMAFYYPNFNNDMWRIMGLVFFDNKDYFVDTAHKTFRLPALERFLAERGIALYDTATVVRRLNDNASDKFLEVVEATDVVALLRRLPQCTAVAVTGQKACDTLCALFGIAEPGVGSYTEFTSEGRAMRLYRMPSTSRAYPLKMEKKAEAYRAMMRDVFVTATPSPGA